MIYRQGDIVLKKVNSLPEGLKKQTNNILAYGEVTGHKHQFVSDMVITYADELDNKYVKVLSVVPLQHEEHKWIDIEEGTYEVVRQREYDPKENRLVVD